MKYKIVPSFFTVIVALIVGTSLFREFDFETMKFENPALAFIYGAVLILTFALMLKKNK